jgi:hypothetical protein
LIDVYKDIAKQSKAMKATTVVASADFLPVIFLILFTAHTMAWLMSFCSKRQNRDIEDEDGDDNYNDDAYVNPYRLVPRKEHENYIRYERQMYLDSLRK